MPIINPGRSFQGAGMDTHPYGVTIKPGVRTINFRDPEIKSNGIQLFILAPYKTDSAGAGVWYKVFKIRDFFGLETKEKFVSGPNCPVEYFASKVKLYYPALALVSEEVREGKKVKVYPSYGRTTARVLFNTAMFKSLHLGAHVMEVPQFGCADVIDAWTRRKTADGSDSPLLNNWEASIPVEFKLKQNAVGNPWQVVIDPTKTYKLPVELADSDYLYNLDEIILYPAKDEVIEKLRRITPNDVFQKCIAGYTDGAVTVSFGGAAPVTTQSVAPQQSSYSDSLPFEFKAAQSTVAQPQVIAPAFTIPKANHQGTVQAGPMAQEVPKVQAAYASNPIAGLDLAKAKAFLKG